MAVQTAKDASVGECLEPTCKAKSQRLNFCERHYDEFKFGVIRKDGTHPTDHEKKLGHYEAFLKRTKHA